MPGVVCEIARHMQNPAYRYPKTGKRPVLVISGLGMACEDDGSGFLSRVFLSQYPEKLNDWGVRFLNFQQGKSRKATAKNKHALQSGVYTTVVIDDLHLACDNFGVLLGSALKRFVMDFGGAVAFVSSDGRRLVNQVLRTMFPVLTWRATRQDHVAHTAVDVNRVNVARIFTGTLERTHHVTSTLLEDVLAVERYFASYPSSDVSDSESDWDESRIATAVAMK